jgi:hypothetical protein
MIELEPYLKVLKKTKITQPQFLFLYCIYFRKVKHMREYKEIFSNEDNAFIGKIYVEDLERLGFLTFDVIDGKMLNYKVTKKFANLFVDEYIAIGEIWTLYPDFIKSKGNSFPLKAADPDKLAEVYFRKIGGSVEEHEEVIKDVTYMVDNNLVYCKIDTFITSKGWLTIRPYRIDSSVPASPVHHLF